jgi:hypothetical protein
MISLIISSTTDPRQLYIIYTIVMMLIMFYFHQCNGNYFVFPNEYGTYLYITLVFPNEYGTYIYIYYSNIVKNKTTQIHLKREYLNKN